MPTSDRTKLSPAADASRLSPPPSFRRAAHRLRVEPAVMIEDLPTRVQLDISRALRLLHQHITRGETMGAQVAALVQGTSWPDGAPGDTAYRRNILHIGHLASAGLAADRDALVEITRILDLLPRPGIDPAA